MKSLLIACSLLFSQPYLGNTIPSSLIQDQVPEAAKVKSYPLVDTLLTSLLKQTKVAGLSISVSRSGSLIYAKGFGHADVANKVAMRPNHQIRTASVAKVITATALGRLASNGLLDFDKPIGEYLPYLKAPYAQLTVRQIAGHTAGLPHRPEKKYTGKQYTQAKESLAFFKKDELLFEPGTGYRYSSLGYNLLAILIEEISGKPYTNYMKEDVFAPLGMSQTLPDDYKSFTKDDAKLYYFQKGKLKAEKRAIDGSYKLAGAGFRSTSSDLVKLMDAYRTDFISSPVVKEMFTGSQLKDGKPTFVGIGWRLNEDLAGNATIEHAGSWQGARTVVVYYPERELAISIMINTQCTHFIEETTHLIAQYFLKETEQPTSKTLAMKDITVNNNRSDGSIERYEAELIQSGLNGALQIKTDRSWLKQNDFYALPIEGGYALSTTYGLLYMKLEKEAKLNGAVYQYQVLSDQYHMRQGPMLSFK